MPIVAVRPRLGISSPGETANGGGIELAARYSQHNHTLNPKRPRIGKELKVELSNLRPGFDMVAIIGEKMSELAQASLLGSWASQRFRV